jgi:uncharacterized protein YaiI (UPF0178 family)
VRIYIDGDACPVKDEAVRAAARHKVPVTIVSNGGLRPSAFPGAEFVFVGSGLDEADHWIAGSANAGDIVVTFDIPLAASVIAKGARVVKPDGGVLTDANIGAVAATRGLMAGLRSADPFLRGSGKGFGAADRSRFSVALDRELGR